MMKGKILLAFGIVFQSIVIAQTHIPSVFLVIKNECRYARITYYDSVLNSETLKPEVAKIDTVFIEQNGISTIDGLTLFSLPKGQLRLLTLPGDSIEITCNKEGNFSIKFLNKSSLHLIRQKELDQWPITIIDASFITQMKRYRSKKDINNLIATYEQGHAKRQREVEMMYKGYTHLNYYKTKAALAGIIKYDNIFREKFFMSVFDTTTINNLMDSLIILTNNPLLINLPSVYNGLAGMLYKISKQNPKYYTNNYWFNYLANKVQPGPLQRQLLLYYVQRCKTPQWYDSLAARFAQLYPDKEATAELTKYRKLKFLNLNNQTSCSVTDTVGNIVSFDSLVAQHKGKPLYIDFWASWCAPCLAEMPQSKKLRQLYQGKVQFIYISVDDRTEQWLGGLKRNKLQPAAHYLLPDGLFVYKGNKIPVTGVPRHILIDAEGNMVDDHAPGPGDKLLPVALKSLIKR